MDNTNFPSWITAPIWINELSQKIKFICSNIEINGISLILFDDRTTNMLDSIVPIEDKELFDRLCIGFMEKVCSECGLYDTLLKFLGSPICEETKCKINAEINKSICQYELCNNFCMSELFKNYMLYGDYAIPIVKFESVIIGGVANGQQ